MQEAEKPGGAYNELEAPHHQSFVYLDDHQSQNLHNTEAGRPTVQKVSPFHAYTEHLNDIWRQQLHQQQEVELICSRKIVRINKDNQHR